MRRMPAPRTRPKLSPRLLETRSQAWREVGLLRQISPRVVKRARLEALLLVPLFVVVVVIYDHRVQLFGTRVAARPGHPAHHHLEQALDTPITVITVLLLVTLGWAIARDIGRGLGPPLFRRSEEHTSELQSPVHL